MLDDTHFSTAYMVRICVILTLGGLLATASQPNANGDNDVAVRVGSMESRLDRVERDIAQLQRTFNDAIIGSVDRPGLADQVRSMSNQIDKLSDSVTMHQRYLWFFHGLIVTGGAAIGFIVKMRKGGSGG